MSSTLFIHHSTLSVTMRGLRLWQWVLLLQSNIFLLSPTNRVGRTSAQGEVVQVAVGQATDHVADVLFIVDTSSSVAENYVKMRESLKRLISNFEIGDEQLRVAVVQCNGLSNDLDDLILLHLKEGSSKANVDRALGKLKSDSGNPFFACFKAASERIFKKENGDRLDAPNVIIFTSDADFTTEGRYRAPTKEVDALKKSNVTIVAISFCKPIMCKRTIANNNKIASRPEYSVKMEHFNADNEAIKRVLQHSTSCKQRVEMAECAWVGGASCERSIIPEAHFSNKICEKNANKSILMTQTSVEDFKSCANVTQFTSKGSCMFDKEQKCRVRNFEVEHRAKNRLDEARSGDPIAEDFEACGLAEPKGEVCPETDCTGSKKPPSKLIVETTSNAVTGGTPFTKEPRNTDSPARIASTHFQDTSSKTESTFSEENTKTSPGDISANAAKENPDDVKKSSSKGLITGIIIFLIILAILGLIMAIFLVRRKRRKASGKKNVSVNAKNAAAKSVGLAADVDENSRLMSTKSKTTTSGVSGSKTAKSGASVVSKGRKDPGIKFKETAKIVSTKAKSTAKKNAKGKSTKISKAKS